MLISCSYLKSSGVNKVEWRWIMHYTLNNGTEERVWAVIEQNLLLSVKDEDRWDRRGHRRRLKERRQERREGRGDMR